MAAAVHGGNGSGGVGVVLWWLCYGCWWGSFRFAPIEIPEKNILIVAHALTTNYSLDRLLILLLFTRVMSKQLKDLRNSSEDCPDSIYGTGSS